MRAIEEDFFQFPRFSSTFGKLRQFALQILFLLDLLRFRFTLAELNHHMKILDLPLRLNQRVDLFAQGIGLVNVLLGLFAIVPEGVRRHQGVELSKSFLRAWDVKETSANARVSPPPGSTEL